MKNALKLFTLTVLALAVNSVAFSQGAVSINDTTYYLITEGQARAVIMLDAETTAIERENELLRSLVVVKDSIIAATAGQVENYAAIDTAHTEVIGSMGERIELSRRQIRRAKSRAAWAAIKGAWREITIGVTAAGVGYGVGRFVGR